MENDTLVQYLSRHWEVLAAFAWQAAEDSGPGAVVVHRDELSLNTPTMNWFAAADVPTGDDYRTLMMRCNRATDVMVVVVDDQSDQAVVLNAGPGRPPPEACAREASAN